MSLSYIQVSNQSYHLTDQCNKPYLNIGAAKLPLSAGGSGTNTMNLHIVAGGGVITIEL